MKLDVSLGVSDATLLEELKKQELCFSCKEEVSVTPVLGEQLDINSAFLLVLVKALCANHNVKLLHAPSSKTLGEWAGLCKIDSEGKARKVVGCFCVVVKDYGEQHEAVEIVQQHKD
ncbi:40S ribosomal protein S12 [Hibiscus syriacus]|uniref:40S ribosomal protein S12 n=1 Tax=Hibiscus syriacus TaxID=106335 RepID=A0A6A3A0R4_HIBSY|nr:40S ribosomal protein S12 [Hibiscus syriacus]